MVRENVKTYLIGAPHLGNAGLENKNALLSIVKMLSTARCGGYKTLEFIHNVDLPSG